MPKLLIIDDEDGIVREVKDFFLEEGFHVASADTGEDGKRLIWKEVPDLVLLDLKLPDMSGLEVLKMLRASFPNCKVIVNTGYVDQNLMDQATDLGCDAFLSKPFNLIRLKDEVERVLNTEV
ncbi:MAG: response regulator [Candidatus Omnitrophica bacterium]|nr:response regulator [Candidatus Omnitrophota bacterium]